MTPVDVATCCCTLIREIGVAINEIALPANAPPVKHSLNKAMYG